jgi:hypothetical protein
MEPRVNPLKNSSIKYSMALQFFYLVCTVILKMRKLSDNVVLTKIMPGTLRFRAVGQTEYEKS